MPQCLLGGTPWHMTYSVEKGIERLDGRVDHLTERMDDGFARMDARMDRPGRKDGQSCRAHGHPYSDALMTAITSTRIYPDTLSARLEREVQELAKVRRT